MASLPIEYSRIPLQAMEKYGETLLTFVIQETQLAACDFGVRGSNAICFTGNTTSADLGPGRQPLEGLHRRDTHILTGRQERENRRGNEGASIVAGF